MHGVSPIHAIADQRWGPLPANLAVSSRRGATRVGPGILPIAIVLFAVLFNAGLAIVNAHVTPLTASSVIAVEVLIVAAAHAVVLWHYRPQMLAWYAVIAVAMLFAVERGLVLGTFEPKFLRDVMLIATFALLRMTTPKNRLVTLVVTLHVIVLGGVLYEALFTESFSALFDVRGYYIATRAFDASDFWNSASDLFVSATRPGNRFLELVELHRVSSVFLEPVSLGNYVVIITAFLCANYRNMSFKTIAFLMVGNFVALVACDGRLAAVSSAIIVLAAWAAPRLPQRSTLLYLPGVLIGAVLLVIVLHPNQLEDNFPGRIAYGIELLSRFEVADWLGNSDTYLVPAADSGLAYAITTQSVVGLMAFWIFLVFGAKERTPEQIRYLHGLCVYFAMTMLVSSSLFSIKMAALLWFIFGSLQMDAAGRVAAPRGPTRGRQRLTAQPALGAWRV